MNEKKISVIVPVYNAEETIERCIVKIFRGGYRNIEMIVYGIPYVENMEIIRSGEELTEKAREL